MHLQTLTKLIILQLIISIKNFSSRLIRHLHDYNKAVSEFEASGLTPEYTETLKVPYVKESKIKMGCRFVEEHEIKINGTIFIVGEILEVILPDDIVGEDGFIDIEKAGTIAVSGLDRYHETKRIARLIYTKPGVEPKEI
ncbi:MAG: hypothetical protein Kow0098_29700 [Ignavibacteriaceae bacterium]